MLFAADAAESSRLAVSGQAQRRNADDESGVDTMSARRRGAVKIIAPTDFGSVPPVRPPGHIPLTELPHMP